MPYNPSVQDRSGEILAQGISQGFSSLTQGVEKYYKKKEENEFLNTAIQGKLGTALNEMQKFQANPAAYGGVAPINPEMLEKFQNIGGASTAKLKALNADFDVMLQRSANGMKEAGAESQRLQNVAQTNLLANSLAVSQKDNAGMLSAGLKISAVKPGELTPEAIFRIGSEAGLSPGAMAQFSESAKDLLPKAPRPSTKEEVQETDSNGNPVTVTYRVDANGARTEIGRQLAGNAGMKIDNAGGLVAITGGEQDVKAQEKLAKKTEETNKTIERAKVVKAEVTQALQTVNEAINLVEGGVGGSLSGIAPVRATMAVFGQPAGKVLDSKYTTIGSYSFLNKLEEMKDLSKNGASGLGSLNATEGVALKSSIAVLDPSLPREEQLGNLKKIKANLMRLGGVPEASMASGVRYDKNGHGYVRGPNGEAIPVNR